ncbi:unnamed protein product [Amoebophrya sp. A25]|nr:unnamed protein product [Amoebophrya sp. A25]|eukprot:GSA25T00016636001.1
MAISNKMMGSKKLKIFVFSLLATTSEIALVDAGSPGVGRLANELPTPKELLQKLMQEETSNDKHTSRTSKEEKPHSAVPKAPTKDEADEVDMDPEVSANAAIKIARVKNKNSAVDEVAHHILEKLLTEMETDADPKFQNKPISVGAHHWSSAAASVQSPSVDRSHRTPGNAKEYYGFPQHDAGQHGIHSSCGSGAHRGPAITDRHHFPAGGLYDANSGLPMTQAQVSAAAAASIVRDACIKNDIESLKGSTRAAAEEQTSVYRQEMSHPAQERSRICSDQHAAGSSYSYYGGAASAPDFSSQCQRRSAYDQDQHGSYQGQPASPSGPWPAGFMPLPQAYYGNPDYDAPHQRQLREHGWTGPNAREYPFRGCERVDDTATSGASMHDNQFFPCKGGGNRSSYFDASHNAYPSTPTGYAFGFADNGGQSVLLLPASPGKGVHAPLNGGRRHAGSSKGQRQQFIAESADMMADSVGTVGDAARLWKETQNVSIGGSQNPISASSSGLSLTRRPPGLSLRRSDRSGLEQSVDLFRNYNAGMTSTKQEQGDTSTFGTGGAASSVAGGGKQDPQTKKKNYTKPESSNKAEGHSQTRGTESVLQEDSNVRSRGKGNKSAAATSVEEPTAPAVSAEHQHLPTSSHATSERDDEWGSFQGGGHWWRNGKGKKSRWW